MNLLLSVQSEEDKIVAPHYHKICHFTSISEVMGAGVPFGPRLDASCEICSKPMRFFHSVEVIVNIVNKLSLMQCLATLINPN